jgi:EAL domain-containing protein (putative c-di-GMP-specific phosphodiesterase class I)
LIQQTLAAARGHFGMDVAFVSEFADGRRVFRHVDGAAGAPIAVGDGDHLEESYCQRVVDGRLPEVIADARDHEEALALPATAALPVGAHLSVPITLANGRIFGTLCCFRSQPDPSLTERDAAVMHLLAAVVADQLTTASIPPAQAAPAKQDRQLQRLERVGWPAGAVMACSAVFVSIEQLTGRHLPAVADKLVAALGLAAVVAAVIVALRWRRVRIRLVAAAAESAERRASAAAQQASLEAGRESVMEHFASRGSLTMVFQPIYDLRDGRLLGHEALARFSGGRRPDECIAEAHDVGLGVELEFLALTEAVRTFDATTGYLAVNLSPAALRSAALQRFVAHSRHADRLVLELTEHAVIEDYESIVDVIAQFRLHGTKVAVDDAGAGFASMRHITDLRPDIVKLDRSIIDNVDGDAARYALVGSLVTFATGIGATVVAEGIERQQELEACRALGVHSGQGYLLGRPAATSAPDQWVQPQADARSELPARPGTG